MAVTFTPNIGLAKPTESELALLWARTDKLQEDNNLIIMDKSDVNLVSYTPVVAAVTTPFNVGAGSVRGEYQDFQGFVMGSFLVDFTDPGVAAGSGDYAISLPFPVDPVYHIVGTSFNSTVAIPGLGHCIGEGYINDASAVNTSGTIALDAVTVAGVSYARMITETYTGKTNQVVNSAAPFVVATNDRFAGSFFYKRV